MKFNNDSSSAPPRRFFLRSFYKVLARRRGGNSWMAPFLSSLLPWIERFAGWWRTFARPFRLSDNIIRGWDKLSHFSEKCSQGFREFKGWCKKHMAHYLLPPFLVSPWGTQGFEPFPFYSYWRRRRPPSFTIYNLPFTIFPMCSPPPKTPQKAAQKKKPSFESFFFVYETIFSFLFRN